MEKEALVQIIQRAIQTERDGNLFYSRAAETIRDLKAKKMFRQLAMDELYHVDVIEDLYLDLMHGAVPEPVKGYPVFDETKKCPGGEAPDFGSEAEVLEMAIGDEINSLNFYRETAEAMGPGQGREVFYDLMEMEQGHIRLLRAELDSLEKTGLYFDHMEFNLESERE